jgi:hypothetical protein
VAQYTVFYVKDLPAPTELPTRFERGAYERAGIFEAESLDHLYDRMQGERLEETEQGRALIERCRALPLHTSMSAGDVAVDPNGQYWFCALRGWEQLETPK